jgi:hypothetical protein
LPPEKISRATSFAAMAQQLTQSFGVGLAALVVHMSLVWHDRAAIVPDDVTPGYLTLGLLSLASALVFWRLPARAGAQLSARWRWRRAPAAANSSVL